MMHRPHHAGRARILVWLTLAVTALGVGVGLSADVSDSPLPPAAAADADQAVVTFLTGGPDAAAPVVAQVDAPAVTVPERYQDPRSAGLAPQAAGSADPSKLPAWRWTNVELDADASGWLKFLKQIPVVMAEMMFGLAMTLWKVLLTLIKLGLVSDIIMRVGARPLNGGFAYIASKLALFLPVFLAVIFWRVAKSIVKGNVVKALRTGAIFTLFFAALVGMGVQAQRAQDNADPTGMGYPGSPSWVGMTVMNLGSQISGPLASVVGKANDSAGGGSVRDGLIDSVNESCSTLAGSKDQCASRDTSGVDAYFNCTHYTRAMHAAYLAGSNAEGTLVIMSELWENTFLKSWSAAAFGEPGPSDLPNRAICHWAEEKAGTSVTERWATAQAAATKYYGRDIFTGTAPYYVFGPFDDDDADLRKATTGFAACTSSGGKWSTHPAWKYLEDSENRLDTACAGAFGPAVLGDTTGADTSSGSYEAFEDGIKFGDLEFFAKRVVDWTDNASRSKTEEARAFGLAFSGANPGMRMLHGIIAIVVAIAFIWTLGFVAIGLVVSSLMAIAGLLLGLPVALVAKAVDSPKAGGLLRVIASSLLAKTMFTLLISALILISGVFQALIKAAFGLGDGWSGGIGSLLFGVAPVLAMLILRTLLKSIGMADLLSPTGAMSFSAAAALKASGNNKLQNFATTDRNGQNGLQRGLYKAPLGVGNRFKKLDRYGAEYWSKDGAHRRRKENKEDAEAAAKKKAEYDKLKNPAEPGTGRLGNGEKKRRILARVRSITEDIQARSSFDQTDGRPVDYVNADPNQVFNAPSFTTGAAESAEALESNRAGVGRFNDANLATAIEAVKAANPDLAGLDSADPRVHAAAKEYLIGQLMQGAVEATGGSFKLHNTAEMDGLRIKAAEAYGCRAEDLLVTPGGLLVPNPEADLRRLPPEMLRSYVHWLPPETRERQMINDDGVQRRETDSELAARIWAIGMHAGFIGPGNTEVDYLASKGIDISDAAVAQALADHLSGVKVDARFENLTITSHDSADRERLSQLVQKVTAEQVAGFTKLIDQRLRETGGEVLASVEALRAAELPELAAQLTQVDGLAGVIAGLKDELAEARHRNDHTKVEQISDRLAKGVSRFEAVQEAVVDSVESIRLGLIEAGAVSASLSGASAAQIEEAVQAETNKLRKLVEENMRKTMDNIRNGRSTEVASINLQSILRELNHDAASSFAGLVDSLAKSTEAASSEQRRDPRYGPTPSPGSARKKANDQDHTALP